MAESETISWLSSELLQCEICLESYKQPKWLDCGHSFCLECIKGYVKGKCSTSFNCPTCRESTKLPRDGPEGLRNDFKARKLEGLISEKYSKKLDKSNLCNFCETNNIPILAKKYCMTCCKRFCDDCLLKHSQNQIFHNHSIVDSQTHSANTQLKQPCQDHPQETIAYYCQSCDQLVCTLCLIGPHNDHVAVDIVTAVKKEKLKSVDMLRLWFDKLKDICVLSLDTDEQEIDKRKDEVIAAVSQDALFLKEELTMLRTMKMKDLEAEMEKSVNKVNDCENLLDVVNITNSMASCLQNKTLYKIACFTNSTAEIKLGSFQQRNIVLDQLEDGISFCLQSDQQMPEPVTNLEQQIEITVEEDSVPNLHQNITISQISNQRQILNVDQSFYLGQSPNQSRYSENVARPLRAMPRLVFCVNGMGEQLGKLNDPIGVGELNDGRLIVCEWANRRLQIFSQTGVAVKTLLNGQISPQGIVITVKGNILVSDSAQKKVFAFDPDGKAMSKSGIGKFTNPCGLAFSKHGNIIVSDTSENTVTVYKNDQAVAFKLGVRQSNDRSTHCQFRNPLYVAAGPNNEILVSDSDNHCVKVFDSRGKYQTRMGSRQGSGDGELSFPRGLCVDSNGYVIVADRNNDRICAFNMRGEFQRHFLTRENGVVSPYAVAITSKNQLVVTESEPKRASLKLFQL